MTNIKSLLWHFTQVSSLEHFSLVEADDHYLLKGTVVCLLEEKPACINYTIRCTSNWETRSVKVHQQWNNTEKHLSLEVDEAQNWTLNDEPLDFASGFIDIDLGVTPATNTLPIRRFALMMEEGKDTTAVWLRFPALSVEPLSQRYTRIGEHEYTYESFKSGFRADLHFDDDGVVIRYGDFWQRVP